MLRKIKQKPAFSHYNIILREVSPGEFVIVSFNRISLAKNAVPLKVGQILTIWQLGLGKAETPTR